MKVGDLISYNVGSGRKSMGLVLKRDKITKPMSSYKDSYDSVLIDWCHVNKVPAMLDMSGRMSSYVEVGTSRWYRVKTPSGSDAFKVVSTL